MIKEAGKSDPAAAARWLETQDGELITIAGSVLAMKWAERDPGAAFAWAHQHGVPLTQQPLRRHREMMFAGHSFEISGDSPVSAAMQQKPDATLAWVRTLPAGAERERYLELAITHAQEPAKVMSLVTELPPEAAARAAAAIVSRLVHRDFPKAQQWAESLAPGPAREAAWVGLGAARGEPLPTAARTDRDAMLSGIALQHATGAPGEALNRALEITDPQRRRRAFDDVLAEVFRGPRDLGHGAWHSGPSESIQSAAREALEQAPVPEEWKREWRDK